MASPQFIKFTVPSQMDVDAKRNDDKCTNLELHFQKAKYLQQNFQQRYRTFAMFTTMHGFLEVQTTRSVIFKGFWTLIICVALGFTFYQVYQATSQYVNQSTTTTIEQVKRQDLRYPPLYLCVNHWIQWVDWAKAFAHNYTKKAILYGFSCDSTVFSSRRFDLVKAAEEFERAQKINNISTYRQFSLLVAKSVDDFITEIYDKEEDSPLLITASDLFKAVEINGGDQLCYIAKSDDIKAALEKPKLYDLSKGHMFRMSLSTSAILDDTLNYLTMQEYASYIFNWMTDDLELYFPKSDVLKLSNDNATRAELKTYLQVAMPIWLFVNGYSGSYIEVMPQVDKYKIIVKAMVNRWLDKTDKPCVKEATYIFPDSTCFDSCKDKKRSDLFGMHEVEKYQSTRNRTCCTGEIEFLNVTHSVPNVLDIKTKDNRTDNATTIRKELGLSCSVDMDDDRVEQFVNESGVQCEKLCDPLIGCETWRFEIGVDRSSMYSVLEKLADKLWTIVIISYPSDGETLVVVETDKQSWDNFVGSIGGIVGVWTGASILSFIQIFYLCICAPPAE